MAKFTVDTHLFRELGELLVGRDSTALIELIKNSYDADATEVVVLGQSLNDPEKGLIVITDNGTGMTPREFEQGFLRVASRLKDSDERRSQKLQRRYTGAKGIGRLAAHKLAKLLEVESIPWEIHQTDPDEARFATEARIDWEAIEEFETLDEIGDSNAVSVDLFKIPEGTKSGTTLRLSRLRRRWSNVERARFFAEVQSFAPPAFLVREKRQTVITEDLLFSKPLVRLAKADGQEFSVRLEGEFASGDDYWRLMEDHASWVIEIRCRPDDSKVHYAIAPTNRTQRILPEAKAYSTEYEHPDPQIGPFFDARIFLRVGQLSTKGDQRTWATRSSGVRVYMEGFRVLPYGESQNDWLRLDEDYTRRSRTLDTLRNLNLDDLDRQDDKDAALTFFPNNNYFGGVFLVHEYAENLRMLVNREGFVPERGYDHLVRLVRMGLDLCTRVHASASYYQRKARKAKRRSMLLDTDHGQKQSNDKPSTNPLSLRTSLEDATNTLREARSHVISSAHSEADTDLTAKLLNKAIEEIHTQAQQADEMISEQALLRVLASVGTQMSTFVHEIRALLGICQAIEHALESIASEGLFAREQRNRLFKVMQAVGDLRRGLEREASYLVDIVTPDSRRRRSRQRIFERFDAASKLIAHTAERREIKILNKIPKDITSPPMFPAEITAVFTNLLSNAVKAAGSDGRVHASAFRDDDGATHVIVQNTGAVVDLDRAEVWFQPFESTTTKVDPVLGQGMGLGLPITRRILDDYGAEIRFIKPRDSLYATAIIITFPGER